MLQTLCNALGSNLSVRFRENARRSVRPKITEVVVYFGLRRIKDGKVDIRIVLPIYEGRIPYDDGMPLRRVVDRLRGTRGLLFHLTSSNVVEAELKLPRDAHSQLATPYQVEKWIARAILECDYAPRWKRYWLVRWSAWWWYQVVRCVLWGFYS